MTQRATVVLWVPVFVVICAASMIGVSRLGEAAVDRARTDSIADVVALAAVSGGRVDAERVSQAGAAHLSGYEERSDGSILVTVQRGSVSAQAAATDG